ncbi:DUF4331 family protein [Streptomyces sp. CNZ748]|uniref:DUF4331 family protein n=1 Tax=Streptomyces sp. CNZ748 TaxID=2885160 RepID=UPI001E2F973F|nr:DUF4331 family protein [Streptomyces sp. CNZ748]
MHPPCSGVTPNVLQSPGENLPRGLHPEGRYEFKLDGSGDAIEDVTYRFTFEAQDAGGIQAYQLHRLTGRDASDPRPAGTAAASGSTGQSVALAGCGRMWVGKAGDPFWVDPHVRQAVGHAFQDGTGIDLSSWDSARAKNLFAGHTVYSIVLELSDDELAPGVATDGSLGVWAVASLATDAGGWRPINQASLPMIHPLFAQFDEALGDQLNETVPADDAQLYGKTVTDKVTGVVRAGGAAEAPDDYSRTVANRVLPNVLPYAVGPTPRSASQGGTAARSPTTSPPLCSRSPVTGRLRWASQDSR